MTLLGGDARDILERTNHELGHTLGFRHEHTVPTSTSDGSVRFIQDTIDIAVWAVDASTASLEAAGKTIYVGSGNGGVWMSMEPGTSYTYTIDPRSVDSSTGDGLDVLIATRAGTGTPLSAT